MIHNLWLADQNRLVTQFEQYENLYYFIPYYRKLADSHCSSLADFEFTDVHVSGDIYDLGDFIRDLLSKRELRSYLEPENPADYDKSNWLHDLLDSLFRKQAGKMVEGPSTLEEFYQMSSGEMDMLK